MTLMPGWLYDTLLAGNVPDDEARDAGLGTFALAWQILLRLPS